VRKLLAALTITLSAAVTVAPPAPAEPGIEPSGAVAIPEGPAQAWLLADLDTGRILASRNPYESHAPASTIKVLLTIVALDQLNLNSAIIARPANTAVECSCAGIKPGRVYTARQLLDAVMLISGNDAANTLADMLGGFYVAVAKMNAKAYALGARNTRVTTPSGLDAPGGDMHTTPYDLALIFRAALTYPMFGQIARQPSALFPDGNGYKEIVNQNELLQRYPGALGGKTGYTNIARKTYVGAAQRNGHRLVVVQMYGEGDMYGQAIGLLDWGFNLYR
jgi:serine-type D-Ala-D-Ala carboxypeptidase (penicillin-binding protein 5/6)